MRRQQGEQKCSRQPLVSQTLRKGALETMLEFIDIGHFPVQYSKIILPL